MTVAIDLSLALLVLCAWIGAIGFVRLRSSLDRLHCVTFVNAAGGAALVLATLLADGVSARSLKTVLLWLAALVIGAGASHVTARALQHRGSLRRVQAVE